MLGGGTSNTISGCSRIGKKFKIPVRDPPLWVTAAIASAALILIAATLVPLIPTNWWPIRIFAFPQAQIAVLLVIVAVVALLALDLSKGWPKVLIAALGAAVIYQLSYLLNYSPLAKVEAAGVPQCRADRRVSLLVLNVLESNSDYDATIRLVRQVKPDLFLAMETDWRWARALRRLTSQMPNVVAEPRDDPWGIMFFSRLPLKNAAIRHLVQGYVPSVRAWVELGSGDRFIFHGLHPKPPLMHSSARGDAELVIAGREVRRSGEPSILAGDLNDVPWSATTQLFQQVSGMLDPRVGRTFLATFMTDNPLLRWPLDHAFVTGSFRVVSFKRLRDVGSDHFPLLATFCLTGSAAAAARS